MKVSWDVKSCDLPLPSRSILDGSAHAAPVALNVLGFAGLRIVRVRVPLTAEQTRRLRPVHLFVVGAVALRVAMLVLVLACIALGVTGRAGVLHEFLPVVFALAATNAVYQVALMLASPRVYPRVPFDLFAKHGWSGRIEMRDVDPDTAEEWRRLSAGAVQVHE
ncbi:hypothetical protein Daura_36255 [Dactylosporangium aurantiacum]|uniref:Uncharacterized protein n=1 Tax=Dactylosporangium aurantiacum TaxID=35754 RepID=A0A9Q9IAB7_9ACTN|nr:hypothetical protein [Dactylosporangium aurantiacum]MDG6103371.1 hypothetical protein [Dactylosporangium aurantiacum]UWZ52111.1 hypothetical protein Daura_36255 [Dactylosporangium aurantiacum]